MEKQSVSFSITAGLFAVALLTAAVRPALATPSTIIWGPSTDVQPFKTVHLTSDFYVPTGNDANDARPSTITNLGLTAGVLPFKNLNAEVGFDHKSGTGLDDDPFYFNAKVGIPEDAYGPLFPAMAVGIYDVGTDSERTDFNVIYGRVGKTFKTGDFSLGRFSVGAFTGNEDLLTYNGEKENEGILLGWERSLPEISDKLWVGVDYQGGKSAYGSTNFGVAYKFAPNASFIVGYDIYNNKDLVDTYTFQVDVDF